MVFLTAGLLIPILLTTEHTGPETSTIGFNCDLEECRKVVISCDFNGMPFTSGHGDLTGDGNKEFITLNNGTLRIYRDDNEVYFSNPDWNIADAAIGDPNHDGRSDVITAVWKLCSEGTLVSHPYIIGYRGGSFHTIWGGSEFAHGIEELILVDFDGDGNQSLVIIEAVIPGSGPGAMLTTVSVWDWNGWGFSLRWRSEEGLYRNLGFTVDSRNDPIIVVDVASSN